MARFPDPDWLALLKDKLNSDEKYAQIARNWEGDMLVVIEPGKVLEGPLYFYLDLWHGTCRDASVVDSTSSQKPVLLLNAPYEIYVQLLKGELEVIQALLTRKVNVKGNMGLLMRNVPTVLDFVRVCREVTDSFI